MGKVTDTFEQVYAPDRATWRAWLEANHASSPGIWLVYFKKESGQTRVEYADAVEEALCFGWIDSVVNPIDERSYKQVFSPRKPKSNWSKLNKERVEQLTAAGLIRPAGQKMIDLAKATGTWDALNEVEQLIEPEELKVALDANPTARGYWDKFSRSSKRAILEWLNSAKQPDTRNKRVRETVEMAEKGLRANFPPDKKKL